MFIPESVTVIAALVFADTNVNLYLEANVDTTEWSSEMGGTKTEDKTLEDFIQALIDANLMDDPNEDESELETE